MGIELQDDDLWEFLTDGHEGVLTTLRRDGWPVALPVWYVVQDKAVYLRTRPTTKKLARIRHDPRSSFLVSGGTRWAELKAAVLTCRAVIVEEALLQTAVLELFDEKYAAFRTAPSAMPASSQKHYQGEPVIIRLDVVDAVLSWDNSRLRS